MLAIVAKILNAYYVIIISHSLSNLILITIIQIVIFIILCVWMKSLRLEILRNLPKDLQNEKLVAEPE